VEAAAQCRSPLLKEQTMSAVMMKNPLKAGFALSIVSQA
jgi:hypothetical protein